MQCFICSKCAMILQKDEIHTFLNLSSMPFIHVSVSLKISSMGMTQALLLTFIVAASMGFRKSQLLSFMHMFWYCQELFLSYQSQDTLPLMVFKLAHHLLKMDYMFSGFCQVQCAFS